MVYFPVKRGREDEMHNLTAMANYLMLLSKGNNYSFDLITNDNTIQTSRVFECKTCSRQFSSFQALGGHRASHKKQRIMGGDTTNNESSTSHPTSPVKPKTHECSICGLEFPIGQALGGHMRRHRAVAPRYENDNQAHHSHEHDHEHKVHELPIPLALPILKRGNSGRRVFGLDLNLTPLENDCNLEIGIAGKTVPLIELCL